MELHEITSIKALNEYIFQQKLQDSSLPPHAIPKPRYSEKDTNALTKAIITYIKLHPLCEAWRVNNTGVYDTHTQKFRKSNTRKGIADISAVRNGQAWQIEIKKGKDRLSIDQIKFKADVEKAGGIYFIARNFAKFVIFWRKNYFIEQPEILQFGFKLG